MMDVNNRHCHPQPSSLSLRCRWGVSHSMQGKEVRTSGESSSLCLHAPLLSFHETQSSCLGTVRELCADIPHSYVAFP